MSSLNVGDKFGNKVIKMGVETAKKLPIDKVLYLKDTLCLSDSTYKTLSNNLTELP